jgi:hypothetical protein
MQSSTHSSQIKTVGPAMSLRTSCWLFPQKEQNKVPLSASSFFAILRLLRLITWAALMPSGRYIAALV